MPLPWLRLHRARGARANSPQGTERIVVLDRPIRRRFTWPGGRRRLAAVPYLLPFDEREIHRLDFQHYLLRHALQGNFSAPITENPRGYPASVLDVGCGTGRWGIEMAQQFPDANVIGVDLSPLLDEEAALERQPPNFSFVPANVLQGLPFADATFEYVFQRLLFLAIPALLWPGVARELVRVAQMGGWVELVEGSVTEGGGPALATLAEWAVTLSSQRGIDLSLGTLIGPFLKEAGLQHVTVRRVDVPIGRGVRGAQHIARMMATNFMAGLGGLRAAVVGQGVATGIAFDVATKAARSELDRFRCIQPFYVAYGQRSLPPSTSQSPPSQPHASQPHASQPHASQPHASQPHASQPSLPSRPF
jgi:ubiquinone/menaquinone biosynthesis C-methylase UbiE